MPSFDVLADPTRRRILDLLLQRPRLVGELTDELGLSQPGTSKHLRVLREAGLVRVRAEAQRRWYELVPEPLAEIDEWVAAYPGGGAGGGGGPGPRGGATTLVRAGSRAARRDRRMARALPLDVVRPLRR